MLGNKVADFAAPATGGTTFMLSDHKRHSKGNSLLALKPSRDLMKNMYGKKVRGIESSTFLIGPDGTLAREWRGVKVAGHADEVLGP